MFCLFFRFLSTISPQPAGRFTPNFACGRTLVPDVSSPFLGLAAPRGSGKSGKWNFRYYRSQWEIFAFLVVFERYLSNAWTGRIHTRFYLYKDNVCQRAPSPSGVHRSLRAGGGGVKNSKKLKKWGWSHSCSGQVPLLFFSALPNVVQYLGHRPAHIQV